MICRIFLGVVWLIYAFLLIIRDCSEI